MPSEPSKGWRPTFFAIESKVDKARKRKYKYPTAPVPSGLVLGGTLGGFLGGFTSRDLGPESILRNAGVGGLVGASGGVLGDYLRYKLIVERENKEFEEEKAARANSSPVQKAASVLVVTKRQQRKTAASGVSQNAFNRDHNEYLAGRYPYRVQENGMVPALNTQINQRGRNLALKPGELAARQGEHAAAVSLPTEVPNTAVNRMSFGIDQLYNRRGYRGAPPSMLSTDYLRANGDWSGRASSGQTSTEFENVQKYGRRPADIQNDRIWALHNQSRAEQKGDPMHVYDSPRNPMNNLQDQVELERQGGTEDLQNYYDRNLR
jgi:hypothetical protein